MACGDFIVQTSDQPQRAVTLGGIGFRKLQRC
jgi:hypothetical protein